MRSVAAVVSNYQYQVYWPNQSRYTWGPFGGSEGERRADQALRSLAREISGLDIAILGPDPNESSPEQKIERLLLWAEAQAERIARLETDRLLTTIARWHARVLCANCGAENIDPHDDVADLACGHCGETGALTRIPARPVNEPVPTKSGLSDRERFARMVRGMQIALGIEGSRQAMGEFRGLGLSVAHGLGPSVGESLKAKMAPPVTSSETRVAEKHLAELQITELEAELAAYRGDLLGALPGWEWFDASAWGSSNGHVWRYPLPNPTLNVAAIWLVIAFRDDGRLTWGEMLDFGREQHRFQWNEGGTIAGPPRTAMRESLEKIRSRGRPLPSGDLPK